MPSSIDNTVAYNVGRIAAQVVAVIYREVGYADSLDAGSVRQAFRRSEDGGFQTVERIIGVRVAALAPRAFEDRGNVSKNVVGVSGNIPLCLQRNVRRVAHQVRHLQCVIFPHNHTQIAPLVIPVIRVYYLISVSRPDNSYHIRIKNTSVYDFCI